jgi:uncharacterized protein (TIRG00374 family)
MSLKRFWFALQLLITVALAALLFRNFEWARFWEALGRVPAWSYVGSFLVVISGQALYACRWQLVLRAVGIRVRLIRVVRVYFISLFFGSFLPSTVGGDVARVYLLGRIEGFAQVGASVLVDRALALSALTVIGTVLMLGMSLPGGTFVMARRLLAVACLICLVGLAIAAWLPAVNARPASAGWTGKVGARLRDVLALVRRALRAPATVLGVLAVILAYFTLLAVVYEMFFFRFGAQSVGLGPILATVIVINVFSSIPVTVNGMGLREQLHFLLFAELGISKEVAVSVSLILFAHTLVAALVGGLVWLRGRGRDSIPSILHHAGRGAVAR